MIKPLSYLALVFASFILISFVSQNETQPNKITFTPEQLKLTGKKGICFTLKPNTVKDNVTKVKLLDTYWNYSWGSKLHPDQPQNTEFIPMIWGAWDIKGLEKTLTDDVLPQIQKNKSLKLLAFNEPDKKDQANMPYQKALSYWPLLEKLGIPLCSPACANPEGISDDSIQGVEGTWMRDFMKEADKRGYRIDYIGVHWYGGTDVKHFKDKMTRIYEKYGKRPILITEFAPADWQTKGDIKKHRHTPAKVLEFMKEVIPWMESQEWIYGYSWFSFNIDSPQGTSAALFDKNGNLTACGKFYKSVTSKNPKGDQSIPPDPTTHK